MPVANTTLVERIARVIAARIVSRNAEGSDPSAAGTVDAIWQDHAEDARSILRTMREPDAHMADARDAGTWARMVDAALAPERLGP